MKMDQEALYWAEMGAVSALAEVKNRLAQVGVSIEDTHKLQKQAMDRLRQIATEGEADNTDH